MLAQAKGNRSSGSCYSSLSPSFWCFRCCTPSASSPRDVGTSDASQNSTSCAPWWRSQWRSQQWSRPRLAAFPEAPSCPPLHRIAVGGWPRPEHPSYGPAYPRAPRRVRAPVSNLWLLSNRHQLRGRQRGRIHAQVHGDGVRHIGRVVATMDRPIHARVHGDGVRHIGRVVATMGRPIHARVHGDGVCRRSGAVAVAKAVAMALVTIIPSSLICRRLRGSSGSLLQGITFGGVVGHLGG